MVRRRATKDETELFRIVVKDAKPLAEKAKRRLGALDLPPDIEALPVAPMAEGVAPAKRKRGRVPKDDPLPVPAAPPPKTPIPLPSLKHDTAPGLDKRSQLRLKRGQMPIESRIDLHGMTQDAAHAALTGFIARSQARGLRCVLVITGKGTKRDEFGRYEAGVLKREVPRWLNQAGTREKVLAFTAAQPRDGAGGALYVLLRRVRDES
ncbi:MAG: Smr/MutS family protein [Alphaproteobacteria bacterium]|nr:Smr/MutS family protein [Alphaproteobacteria bacterium]MBU0798923.1 Smr/MutS family protein [Alphaproteobacteria bacterium]MBU0886311.1 Smr/MutS family protein [Alphaproteobacteria bacterium]MBU1813493.1 Smr/MutS family protein [Alphaproteobacteria bacterium]